MRGAIGTIAAALCRRSVRFILHALRLRSASSGRGMNLDTLPPPSCYSWRHLAQLRADRLRACDGEHGWKGARSVRTPGAACAGMRRVQCPRRCVEHGRSQDDVIRTARAVAEKKIGLLYVCGCVRESSNMSPIASPDLIPSSPMAHDHREPLDRPFKRCRFFLQGPLLAARLRGVEQTRTHFVTRTGKKVSTMYEVHQHLKVCGLARGVSCGCWGV